MSPLALAVRSHVHVRTAFRTGGVERALLTTCVLAVVACLPVVRFALIGALEDAFLGVGVFVAATFAVFFTLENVLRIDTRAWLSRHQRWEVPIAALLGAMPGCGGAVMVMTQFAMRRASFGAVVAVLTATMGDAAFLVLAQRPEVGVLLIAVGLLAGVVSGYVVQAIHGRGFLQVDRPVEFVDDEAPLPVPSLLWPLWVLFCVPGVVLGVLMLLQVEVSPVVTAVVGVSGGLLSIVIWSLSTSQATHLAAHRTAEPLARRVALNTNFVTVWVVFGFFAFEVAGAGERIEPLLNVAPGLLPMIGVLVGFLPGCGPQILVSTLFLAGAVPLSAQVGNAISNDGDALFPAIAVAPRAALVATIYTAVPALIAAYGCYWLQ